MPRTSGAIGADRRRVRESLDALRIALPDVIRQLSELDQEIQTRTTGSVYQYTTFQSLHGMLGGLPTDPRRNLNELSFKSIWATCSPFLNDSQEFQIGKSLVVDCLKGMGNSPLARKLRAASKDADPYAVYCACFSGTEDDLSQWRGYGDDGRGVCLEFDLQELVESVNGLGFWVVYGKPEDNESQRALAQNLVDYLFSSIHSTLPANPTGSQWHEVEEQIREILPSIYLVFKHRDFRLETEFRMIYSQAFCEAVPVRYRQSPIVPFVELRKLDKSRLTIKSITLGPGSSSEANKKSLKMLLKQHRLGIDVKTSSIPYIPR